MASDEIEQLEASLKDYVVFEFLSKEENIRLHWKPSAVHRAKCNKLTTQLGVS